MSIKKLFGASDKEKNYLSETDTKDAFNDSVESEKNLKQLVIRDNQNVPQINYADPKNFARYGSAYLYYKTAIERILDYYPYDGSDAEINKFYNDSLDIEKYILDNLYPRTNGYITINKGGTNGLGYGTASPTKKDAFGEPAAGYQEYITFYGGPNTGSGGVNIQKLMPNPKDSKFQYSNIYDDDIYETEGLPSDYGSGTRTSNLRSNFDDGVTVEFWLKTGSLGTALTDKQVVFDLWNNEDTSSADYGRIRIDLTSSVAVNTAGTPFFITVQSGTNGAISSSLGQNLDSGQLENWNHYAISIKNSGSTLVSKLYINGGLNHEKGLGSSIGELKSKNMVGQIGALVTGALDTTNPTHASAGAGKLSGSIDEFRFWKVARNGQQISRNWFTQVRGGVNTDISNTTLGLYYKFNEGVTGDSNIDQVVLDYGGRICNGLWTGYKSTSRNTGSAIIEATASAKEYKDPIIRSPHYAVTDLKNGLMSSGSFHDANSNSSFLSLVPGWILDEQDRDELEDLSNIAHIAGAYFDKLYLQISELPKIRQINYVSGAHKPFTFAEHLPQSIGLFTPEIFIDANVMERFANRSDTELFEGSLEEVKNLIYINLYNNLTNIFKSKGTEKAIKNVLRCFNIDDKLLRLSVNANNTTYELRNNLHQTLVDKNCLNLNQSSNLNGVVYQALRSADAGEQSYTRGYLTSSNDGEQKYGFTMETNVIFPHYMKSNDKIDRDYNTVSLFGVTMIDTGSTAQKNGTDTTTVLYNKANFQVLAVRDDKYSKNVYFKLTSSVEPGFGVELTSSTYLNVYDNELWNLSVRLRPIKDPHLWGAAVTNSNSEYELVFKGINTKSTELNESFTLTSTISNNVARNYFKAAKRAYVGAQNTNLTGTIIYPSDVLISSTKYWTKCIGDGDLLQHTLDVENIGISGALENLSPLASADAYLKTDVLNMDTLALNWNFGGITGSTTSPGMFTVEDFSSGSTTEIQTQGWVGEAAGYRHPGVGKNFDASNLDRKHFNSYRLINPEQTVSSDMVQLFSDNDELFPNFRRAEYLPNYIYTIEKSLYNAISEEMLDFFAGIVDFNNIIGHPVNRYRMRYKEMEKLREIFFNRVNSITTVEKYLNYYKWFDDALTEILSQIVPASSEFVNDVMNVVESHVLERNKYKSKFPTLDFIDDDIDTVIMGVHEREYPWFGGSSPQPRSPRNINLREWFWKKRALRTAPEITSGDSTIDTQRNQFKDVIYARPHVSMSLAQVSTPEGSRYLYPDLELQRFTTQYDLKTSDIEQIRDSNVRVGTNYSPQKNIEFSAATFRSLSKIERDNNTYIPLNVLLAKTQDMVEVPEYKNEKEPEGYISKQTRDFKVLYGPDFGDGLTYLNTTSRYSFPFNIISSSVRTGFNEQVVHNVTAGIEITNRHHEGWGPDNNVGLQGPFTRAKVGGHQSRHIALNKGSDNWMTRPEKDKILLGVCLDSDDNGAIGLTDPFYPYPEANDIGVPAYPLTAAQGATYYRDHVAQRPFNFKNIAIVTGANELGNYTYNYEVISSVGAHSNPRQFIESQPALPSGTFGGTMDTTTQIRGLWDIHRTSQNHHEWLSEYSTQYLDNTANKSIMVQRYRTAGGIEQETLGYKGFRASEYSVYNAVPYRNLTVLKPMQPPSGVVGAVTLFTEGGNSTPSDIKVIDIHNQPYGLNAHQARHTARFGRDSLLVTGDSAATNGPGASYDQSPGWHKINRNNREVIEIESVTESPLYAIANPLQNSLALTFGDDDYNASASRKLRTAGAWSSGFSDNKITISSWFRRFTADNNGNGQNIPILSLGMDSSSFGSPGKAIIRFGMTSTYQLYFRVKRGSQNGHQATDGYWFTDDPILSSDGWVHVAVTYDASSTNNKPVLYINAQSQSAVTEDATPSQAGLHAINTVGPGYNYIASHHAGSSNYPTLKSSSVDELAVYEIDLTPSQITTLYCNGGTLDLTGTVAPATGSLVTWMRLGDQGGDPASNTDPTTGNTFYDVKGNNNFVVHGSRANISYNTDAVQGCVGDQIALEELFTYRTASVYDNWYIQHQIPRSDRQYQWITQAVENAAGIRYAGFQPTYDLQIGPFLSRSSGLTYFYDFVSSSNVRQPSGEPYLGGHQPTNRMNILTVDVITGAASDIATNTLGFPNTSDVSQYLNTTLNPTLTDTNYLNILLARRGANYGWTWKQLRQGDHPVLVNERNHNTITVITGSGQTLMDGYLLPPVSLKGRTPIVNFEAPAVNRTKRNNVSLKMTHNNEHIFFNEYQMDNLTKIRRQITPYDQMITAMTHPLWVTNYVIYRQNVYPSLKNEFAGDTTGYRFTTEYKNNVWNQVYDERRRIGGIYNATGAAGVVVSQSIWPLDPPGAYAESVSGIYKIPSTFKSFLARTNVPQIDVKMNSNGVQEQLRGNGFGGALQNAKFSYMIGLETTGSGVLGSGSAEQTILDRRIRSLVPGPLMWAKHMIGAPTSVCRIGAQDIPEAHNTPNPTSNTSAPISGSWNPDQQIEIYAGEADWQSDTPGKAGRPVKTPNGAAFEVTGSQPWYDTYNEYWQDLKLLARGYSVIPEFRISDHVEDYLDFGIENMGIYDKFDFPGVDPAIDSTNAGFYKDFTNSDFMEGFLRIPQEQIAKAAQIRLSCDAAIAWKPQPSFYPAQRAADLVSQFSKSYGDKIVAFFNDNELSGTNLYEQNGGALRPLYEALYSPGILFNTLKAGIACNYPVLTDSTIISGSWFGSRSVKVDDSWAGALVETRSSGYASTNNWALVPGNIQTTAPSNVPAGRSKYQAEGYYPQQIGNPFYKLPFETILEPARYINGVDFFDIQPHPSATLITQYAGGQNSYKGVKTNLATDMDEKTYTLFAENFLGEIPNIFLKGGTFSSIKSSVIPSDLTFQPIRRRSRTKQGADPSAGAGAYFMRIKMVPPSNGKIQRIYENDSSDRTPGSSNSAWGKFGARVWLDAETPYVFGKAEYAVPQWPMYNPSFQRIQTMASRPSSYSSIAIAGRPMNYDTGAVAQNSPMYAESPSTMDSFVGVNPLYTHPMSDGEAWIDCWFYPSASEGGNLETYDLERILAEMEVRMWRFDPGFVTGSSASDSSGEDSPALITASLSQPMFYDGLSINQVSMQASASLNYMGIERVFKTTVDKNGRLVSEQNETAGMRMVISPKFETPIFNFSDQGIRPISVDAGTLTMPTYGSASVNRGIWQQFGCYPTKEAEYPKIVIEGPREGGATGVNNWLKYHYKVVNEPSIYNNYNAEEGYRVSRQTKSLAKLLGFERDKSEMRIGELRNKFILKEAVVAVPYVIDEIPVQDQDPCSQNTQYRKRFISIPPARVKAALKENENTREGQSLQRAGVSIRNLVERMEEFVLPPELDWVHNSKIRPLVMYVFPFEYELDKDDLSYVYQNLAPRNSKRIELRTTSVAHNLLSTELLRAQNIMTTQQLRWMVFKVKQRSTSNYYDHVPNQAGEASKQLNEMQERIEKSKQLRSKTGDMDPQREYQIQYNWPYDYISLVELARLDVEVMYKTPESFKRNKAANRKKYVNKKSALKKAQISKNKVASSGGSITIKSAKKQKKKGGGNKGGGGQY